ncbi:hypothetical protein SAMN04488095_3058 [Jannaschia pohangensis]|uniref:Uncharacterized protein n=2 Tax=Jannaschia pohangensis TaxID=390807 RepID=A0A1I3SBY8_9RHOB|nr:hypothetical protein SAMN04488095_3058 [Jannaschia pohangensis]
MPRTLIALTFLALAVVVFLVLGRADISVQLHDGKWRTETRSVEQSASCSDEIQFFVDIVVPIAEGEPVEDIVWKDFDAAQSIVAAQFEGLETGRSSNADFVFPLVSGKELIGSFELTYITPSHVGVETQIDVLAVSKVVGLEIPDANGCVVTVFADKRFIN